MNLGRLAQGFSIPNGASLPKWAVTLCLALSLTPAAALSQPMKDITIGLSTASLTVSSLRVAKEMGLFEKQGLNPKFVFMDSGNAALSGLIGGSFPAVVATSPDLVAAQAHGQKVVAIANIYSGLGATLVLAKDVADKLGVSPSAPVKDRFKALEGLTLALPSPTAGYTVAFRGAAQAFGVTTRSVYSAASNMQPTLVSGAVQGFITSAPYWTTAVTRGSAVVWLSGPKGDFGDNAPVSSASLQMMRDFAQANPDLVKKLAAVVADLGKAIEERPTEVKTTLAKVFPDVDAVTINLFFDYKSSSWKGKPLTPKDMAHEIALAKSSGMQLPQIDSIDPASLLFP